MICGSLYFFWSHYIRYPKYPGFNKTPSPKIPSETAMANIGVNNQQNPIYELLANIGEIKKMQNELVVKTKSKYRLDRQIFSASSRVRQLEIEERSREIAEQNDYTSDTAEIVGAQELMQSNKAHRNKGQDSKSKKGEKKVIWGQVLTRQRIILMRLRKRCTLLATQIKNLDALLINKMFDTSKLAIQYQNILNDEMKMLIDKYGIVHFINYVDPYARFF
jgi:hypothetical protein